MAVFQISSRSVQAASPPRKKPRRLYQEWFVVIRFIIAINSAGGLFALLTVFKGSDNTVFILLPVFMYIVVTQFPRNLLFPTFVFNVLLNRRPLYLLFTACLALIYYSSITAIVLFIHQTTTSHIIMVTTTLAWAIIFDPVRAYVQRRIEQRFNVRNREAVKAVQAFTATLRQEIDLVQLRERFLTLLEQTMQPYSVALWLRAANIQQEQEETTEEVSIADNDPLLAYALSHPGTREIDRLQLDSPVLAKLKHGRTELVVPLASQGELIGLLMLGPHLKGETYSGEERALLDTLALQVAPALRVAQMVQEQQREVRERERIEQEMRTAQAIQHAFLPKAVPALSGWQLVPYYRPAREVGGDFYDFFSLEDGRWGLVIGDVTGKGVPAALVMATVHTMLRSTTQGMIAPAEILARVNDLLTAEIPVGMFVTCFFAVLDPANGRLHYANAGHEPPYRQSSGCAEELFATGMPLGMLPGTRYEERETTLAPGEALLFYSDGLVEAHNPAREMFGFARMQKLLAEQADGAPLIDVLLNELKRFTGEGWEQEDDVTLLMLQRTQR